MVFYISPRTCVFKTNCWWLHITALNNGTDTMLSSSQDEITHWQKLSKAKQSPSLYSPYSRAWVHEFKASMNLIDLVTWQKINKTTSTEAKGKHLCKEKILSSTLSFDFCIFCSFVFFYFLFLCTECSFFISNMYFFFTFMLMPFNSYYPAMGFG